MSGTAGSSKFQAFRGCTWPWVVLWASAHDLFNSFAGGVASPVIRPRSATNVPRKWYFLPRNKRT